MADPATMGMISLGTTLASGLVGAAGTSQAGGAQSAQYLYQAGLARMNTQIAEQNSTYALAEGEASALKYGLEAGQQMGKIRAGQGASGLDVNSGSAKRVQDSQRTVSTMDLATIRTNAAQVAYNYRAQAAMGREQAKMYDSAAAGTKAATGTNVLASILGTASSVSSKWLQGKQYGMWGNAPMGA